MIKATKGAPAVGTTGPVCCGDTAVGGDCNKDKSGSWSPAPAPSRVSVSVDWSAVLRTVQTSSQIETDVMPFLGRTPDGGDFNGYMSALQNLGAEYMRFSPWFGYPQVVVPELVQTECQGSQANYTLMDGIMRGPPVLPACAALLPSAPALPPLHFFRGASFLDQSPTANRAPRCAPQPCPTLPATP